ncbi:hypothetical protein M501DRAFT_1009317 [Patellaria atrata CBS 101060]|uniref:Uncharacterized protein n=1 Tax=Patellaria atrata CBS 101060 TaxID=1346257 RepID=A0A9P4VRV4_9PEZI|nr:hypothetical protein M501DRAFT_1009317 [Patellaria atrata CBS 101060]
MGTRAFHPHRKPLPSGSVTLEGANLIPDVQQQLRANYSPSTYSPQPPPNNMQIYTQNTMNRRTLSNATASTASTGPARSDNGLRRSGSSRSTNTTTGSSYVALMRRQKATVWCDRAQHEDPGILAQQRAAKMRANREVVGGAQPRTSTSSSGVVSGVRSKIRHHGNVRTSGQLYGANLSGNAVPMRLSASEVDENDSDEDSNTGLYHQRTGSGRSSLGSGRRVTMQSHTQTDLSGRFSTDSTPPEQQTQVIYTVPEGVDPNETPVPGDYQSASSNPDYFATTNTGLSTGSVSSGEGENSFGGLGNMPIRVMEDPEKEKKSTDELRRRGSVDDRTMTMSGVRLFVANPDLSD